MTMHGQSNCLLCLRRIVQWILEALLVLAPVGARLDVSDRDRIMGGNRGAYRHSTSVSDFEECSLSPIHKGGE